MLVLGGRVEPGRRLVQDDEAGGSQKDPGKGQQLRLAGREVAIIAAQFGRQTIG